MHKGKKKEGKMERDETPSGYQRLKVKEVIQDGDRALGKAHRMSDFANVSIPTSCTGITVEEGDGNYYYRFTPSPPDWMADSRPLLAEIAALKAKLEGTK